MTERLHRTRGPRQGFRVEAIPMPLHPDSDAAKWLASSGRPAYLLAAGPAGTHYLVEKRRGVLYRIAADGALVRMAGGCETPEERPYGETWPFEAELGTVAAGPDGAVYFTDRHHHRVCRVSGEDGRFEVVAGGTCGEADGTWRQAQFNRPFGLACDSEGTLYVGDAGSGRIRRISTDGFVSTLKWRAPHNPQEERLGAIVIDDDGNLNVADRFEQRAFRMTPEGEDLGFVGTRYPRVRRALAGPTAPSSPGFYADAEAGRILRVSETGAAETVFALQLERSGDGQGSAARFVEPEAITVSHEGDIYIAEPSNCRVRRITPDGHVSTMAHWHPLDPVLSDGLTRGTGPVALACAKDGTLYGLLPYRGRIVRIGRDGRAVVAAEAYSDADGGWALRSLNPIQSFAVLADQSFVLLDPAAACLRQVATDGPVRTVNLLPMSRGVPIYPQCFPGLVAVTPDGRWLAHHTGHVFEVAEDGTQNALVAIPQYGRRSVWTVGDAGEIIVYDGTLVKYVSKPALDCEPAGASSVSTPAWLVETVAGGEPGAADGPVERARFCFPSAVTVSGGSYLVADAGSGSLRRIRDGEVSTRATLSERFKSHDPTGLAVLPDGAALIAGWAFGFSLVVTPSGEWNRSGPGDSYYLKEHDGQLSLGNSLGQTFLPLERDEVTGFDLLEKKPGKGRDGSRSWACLAIGADGTGWFGGWPTSTRPGYAARVRHVVLRAVGDVYRPIGRCVQQGDDLFVIPLRHSAIFRIEPNGRVSQFAGGPPGFADGIGDSARFREPWAIAATQSGGLVVADRGNHAVRLIDARGDVRTLSGGAAGYVDGMAAEAKFDSPSGIAVAPDGSILVADTGNHAVRRLSPLPLHSQGVARKDHGEPPTWLAQPCDLLGRLVIAVSTSFEGLDTCLDAGRVTIFGSDYQGILTFERGKPGPRDYYQELEPLDPSHMIGQHIVGVESRWDKTRSLPIIETLTFESGVILRLGSDVGVPRQVHEGVLPGHLTDELEVPEAALWSSFAGKTVLSAHLNEQGLSLQLSSGEVQLNTAAPGLSTLSAYIGDVEQPATLQALENHIIMAVTVRYERSSGRRPIHISFRLEDMTSFGLRDVEGIDFAHSP